EFRDRFVATMEHIMSQDNHDTVLDVSHGAACAQFARHWGNTSTIGQVTGLKNCCFLKFEYENGRFTLDNFIIDDFDK
ncbi:histidine phosphatase family protein, partial [Listeria monocytogenes]|nr:histidine phosphatase family protein [Listeria monocytogenes]